MKVSASTQQQIYSQNTTAAPIWLKREEFNIVNRNERHSRSPTHRLHRHDEELAYFLFKKKEKRNIDSVSLPTSSGGVVSVLCKK